MGQEKRPITEMFSNTLNAVKGVKKVVPVNIRQFAGAAFGDTSPLTENDLWASDIEAIKNAVNNTKEPGVIGYGDYGTPDKYDPSDWQGGSKDGIGPFGALIKSYTDPKFRMETTLGMANYNVDPAGNVIVSDRYNFGASPEQINAEIAKRGGKMKALSSSYSEAGFEGLMNALGNMFVAPEGNTGAPVNINLGKIK